MTKRRKSSPAPFPSRDEIVAYVREHPGRAGKRELARAFRLDSEQKMQLKKLLRELESDGTIERQRGRRFTEPGALPSVAVVEIAGPDTDGELLARPAVWEHEAPPPVIYMAPDKRSRAALSRGDRVLARLSATGDGAYEGRVIRKLHAAPSRALGILVESDRGLSIKPVDKRSKDDLVVGPGDTLDARPGELVWAEVSAAKRLGLRHARVVERLGATAGPRSISLLTLHEHDIPARFPDAALRQADEAEAAPVEGREDLRALPLVTIDGADARDFDDAVFAEEDDGGWHLIVAIADVAFYVRPGDALDRAAYERGNSVYFPDRVVPMLPEPLSNGWCSLRPNEDRPCLAAHLWISADGRLTRHRFARAVMRSAARLTYTQAQDARDGRPDEATAALVEPVIAPLYGAYAALARARAARGVLELDLPERRVVVGDDGAPVRVEVRDRFDSHKLIEEFMILANVAAAETLERTKQPCLYRVHDEPSREKIEALRGFVDTLGIKLARGQVLRARDFNQILAKVAGTRHDRVVNEVVLRSQSQAVYDPQNIGHFGLALRRYCHFTSPIRRYADLVVHRALISGLRLGPDGLPAEPGDFAQIGEHVSATERRAAAAERDAVDRFTAAYLAERVGAVFAGRITGVTRFGLFVNLDDSGGDGLVPISTLPDDYYVHDEARHRLVGQGHGAVFTLGEAVEVRLAEADPITGGLILQLMAGGAPPRGARRGRAKPAVRAPQKGRRRHRDPRPRS